MSLKIGTKYLLYTNYDTIVNQKVEVVAILSYNECSKVSYDMSVLAINERVISVKDEDIEEAIGDDNIYHCRAINPNSDGTYTEYLIWDSIINNNKTTVIGEDYTIELKINISSNSEFTVQQVIDTMISAASSQYGSSVNIESSEPSIKDSTDDGELSDEKLETIKGIINSIGLWESKLIPAVDRLTSSGLENTIEEINEQLINISSNISLVKHGL